MKKTRIMVAVMGWLIVALIAGCKGRKTASPQKEGVAWEIRPYVEFIRSVDQDPVDYIMELFSEVDFVVLCERAHNELTQYELIYELAVDPRFGEKVGHIYTELGSISRAHEVEGIITDGEADRKEILSRVDDMYRDFFILYPLWGYRNYHDFLVKIWEHNRNTESPLRVHIHPSDMEFSWESMSREKYKALQKEVSKRDLIMAENVARVYRSLQQRPGARKKALVVMNYRHAFPFITLRTPGGEKTLKNMAGHLMKMFPDRVANVMINSFRVMLPQKEGEELSMGMIQEGKWDAAFHAAGYPAMGFDFTSSPMGQDDFDYFPYEHDYTYKDIFTGFVFYKPLPEHELRMGVPGLYSPSFAEELLRRWGITGRKGTLDEAVKVLEDYDTGAMEYEFDYTEGIQRWLNPPDPKGS